jgi:D-cysteine desulfhydrase
VEQIGVNELSLFRWDSKLKDTLPHSPLGTFPTPVHPLGHLGIDNLWIKRDDLSSDVYGGNKVRKLEFILGDARHKKKKQLITMGGIGTNHGLATAIFSKQLGIECGLLLYWQPVTRHVQQNLRLFYKNDARLFYHKNIWKSVFAFYIFKRFQYPAAYFLYSGGSTTLGTIGIINAVFELKEQIDNGEIPEPGAIICPAASGGTLAGLALGAQLAGLQTEIIGIRVTFSQLGPFHVCTPRKIEQLMKQSYADLKRRSRDIPDIPMKAPAIIHGFYGNGYGSPSKAGRDAYQFVKEREGIELDPTYTAKTFAAVMDFCKLENKECMPVLYWHTHNSVDLSKEAESVDNHELPKSLQPFIEQTPVQS